ARERRAARARAGVRGAHGSRACPMRRARLERKAARARPSRALRVELEEARVSEHSPERRCVDIDGDAHSPIVTPRARADLWSEPSRQANAEAPYPERRADLVHAKRALEDGEPKRELEPSGALDEEPAFALGLLRDERDAPEDPAPRLAARVRRDLDAR